MRGEEQDIEDEEEDRRRWKMSGKKDEIEDEEEKKTS
jgi:hypothetical protein